MTTGNDQQSGSFQQVWTWTAYPVPAPGNYSNVAAPGGTVNSDGTAMLAFYDSNAVNHQPYAEIEFSNMSNPTGTRTRAGSGTTGVRGVRTTCWGWIRGI